MRVLVFICFVSLFTQVYAQKETNKQPPPLFRSYPISPRLTYTYPRPKFFNFITGIPSNYKNLGKSLVQKENLKWLGLTAFATGVLFVGDEVLLEEAKRVQHIGVTEKHQYKTLGDMIDIPTNTSAVLYHLGHGNTSLIVGLGLLSVGGIKKDYRAIHTASEILEGLLTLGVMTQGIKRIVGRESPHASTQPRGRFHGFPGWNEYMKNTSHYDALPSGHVATLTSTVTVLAKNYPQSKWIQPVGYTLIGAMSIEMMNSGVHWASDYPLGFLIGYAVGTVVANSKITKTYKDGFSGKYKGFDTHLTLNRIGNNNLLGVQFVF